MKVIYFHQHFSTPQGATGIRSYEMAKKLIARGHQVTIVCGSYSGGYTGLTSEFISGKRMGNIDGINVVEFQVTYSNEQSFSQRIKAFLKFTYQSSRLALTYDYDIVFCTTTPLTTAIPGILAKWLRSKHFIFEVRDLWPELPKAMGVIKNPIILGLLSLLEWLAYKTADGHIGLSPGIKIGIERFLPKDSHVAMIPNGCDIALFDSQDTEWQPQGIKNKDFVAIFSGTHGLANGLDKVIAVAKELQDRQIIEIKIILIGQGKLKKTLIEQANKYNLTNLIFLEPVNKEQLARLFLRANVGLQTLANIPAFYFGTSPNKFFDYIAAGLPVINNYPGWLANLITQNNCGLAIPADDTKAFANALITLQQNHEQCLKMSKNAKQLAKEQFNRAFLANELVDYFEKSYTS